MAPSAFSNRDAIRRDVIISSGDDLRHCMVLIDADCWTPRGPAVEIGGVLQLPRAEWQALASSERLILKLWENGEPYRMILDGSTGRFLARKM